MMRHLKLLTLLMTSLVFFTLQASSVTQNFSFEDTNFSAPFCILRGNCEIEVNVNCHAKENGKLCVEIYNLKNEKITTVCDLDKIPNGKERYTYRVNYKGSAYLKIISQEVACNIKVTQNLNDFEQKEKAIKEGKLLKSFVKIATWSGSSETVTYEITLKAPMGRLILVSGIPKKIKLVVENDANEKVVDFDDEVISDQSFMIYAPGVYRITISSKHAWILHVLSSKK